MTATRPAAPSFTSTTVPGGPSPARLTAATRRTLLALLASILGVIPLKGLFSDYLWLLDVWVTMIVVLAPAVLLRLRRPPGALDIWPGIILLVPWLTARFVHHHALLGFIPTRRTWHDVSALMTDLHHTTSHEVAPIHTTPAVTLVVCALLGLLAALVDLIAVVGRRGALAGVPLLVVYTVAGAVPRKPVSWVWFAFAAAAYLLLLALDANDDLEHWGRRVQSTSGRARSALSVSTPRIAAAAVVAAVVLPLLVPGDGRNLIANAFHNGNGNGGSSIGTFGGSGGGKLSPFVVLRGQLIQKKPQKLATVHMASASRSLPFYLRTNVLSKVNEAGWGVDSHGDTYTIRDNEYPTLPSGGTVNSVSLEAEIRSTGFDGTNPPVFAVPSAITGLSGGTTWNPKDQLLLGSELKKGDDYTVRFDQINPTLAQLRDAPDQVDDSLRSELALPADFSDFVKNVVNQTVAGKKTPYDRALAITNYFLDPANGFVYDLTAAEGDSGNALVDFLQARKGFCQQYAAATAEMMRYAGIPARVVLGYMHPSPDANGNFTVTTADAHSWVEAYFSGIGWVPFDSTPATGIADSTRNDLPWAPHNTASNSASAPVPTARPSTRPTNRGLTTAAPTTAAKPKADDSSSSPVTVVWLLALLVLLAVVGLVPAAVRRLRRRRRYLAARRDGDIDALWAELSDTATDLGFVWSPARSPRQVAAWLGPDTPASADSLRALAVAIEHGRYSPAPATGDAEAARLVAGLRQVTDELRATRGGRARLRAALWPASLGWTDRLRGRAARRR